MNSGFIGKGVRKKSPLRRHGVGGGQVEFFVEHVLWLDAELRLPCLVTGVLPASLSVHGSFVECSGLPLPHRCTMSHSSVAFVTGLKVSACWSLDFS